jgi:hypothetical protein
MRAESKYKNYWLWPWLTFHEVHGLLPRQILHPGDELVHSEGKRFFLPIFTYSMRGLNVAGG